MIAIYVYVRHQQVQSAPVSTQNFQKTEREIGTTLNLTISGENQLFVITENDGLLDFRLPATFVDCGSLTMV